MNLRIFNWIIGWIVGLIFIISLWIISSHFVPGKIPSIYNVFSEMYVSKNIYWEHFYITFFLSLKGLIGAFLVSLIFISLAAFYPSSEYYVTPLFIMIKATPIIAFVSILIMIDPAKDSGNAKIVATSMICFFPIFSGGLDGLKRTPTDILIQGNMLHSNRIKEFVYLRWGFFLEGLLSGLKVAAPLCIVGAVVAEYAIASGNVGIGVYIASNTMYGISKLIGLVLASALGMLFYLIFYCLHFFCEIKLRLRK